MGWNDRLPEDPYWPEVSQQDDRDSYEQWLAYIEGQLDEANAELSSQNLALEDLRRLSGILSVNKETVREEAYDRKTQITEDEDQETQHTGN